MTWEPKYWDIAEIPDDFYELLAKFVDDNVGQALTAFLEDNSKTAGIDGRGITLIDTDLDKTWRISVKNAVAYTIDQFKDDLASEPELVQLLKDAHSHLAQALAALEEALAEVPPGPC